MSFSISKIERRQWVKFFTHFIVILMVFFLPDMMMNYGRHHHNSSWEWYMYVKSLLFVGLFYINYYLIVGRTLLSKKRHIWAFIGYNLLVVILIFVVLYLLQRNFIDWRSNMRHRHELPAHVQLLREWSFYLRDLVMMILAIALSLILKFARQWAIIEKRHEQMLATQREDELRNLKSQINPHFLFNTLNTIYSLIDISPAEAREAVHMLSKLMRYVLYENPATVNLSQEIEFCRTYISLMQMRLGEGFVKADFSSLSKHDYGVAPLLFITMIENAFKHGNTGNKNEPIEITFTSDDYGVVTCRTINHFRPAEPSDDKKTSGIGLSNLRRRLHLLYGDNATLSTEISGDVYKSTLTIKTA